VLNTVTKVKLTPITIGSLEPTFHKGYNWIIPTGKEVCFGTGNIAQETEIEGTINVSETGILYTSINFDSGWNVYIDGQKVSNEQIVGIGDDALLGVYITEGEHTVSFKYVPQGLLLGCAISALTVVIFLLLISIMKSGLFDFNPPLYVEETEDLEPVFEENANDENETNFDKIIKDLSVDVSVTEDLTEESDAE